MGIDSLRVVSLCVAFSIFFDLIANKLFPSKDFTQNWSSITFAILFAFLLPANSPWWIIMIGCFLLIIVGKKLFGGLGAYPVHPVALSFSILLVSWPNRLDYTASLIYQDWGSKMIEPMRLVKTIGSGAESFFNIQDLLIGQQVGGIGNAMVIWLLLGGLILILSRQITWHIPMSFLCGVALIAFLLHSTYPNNFATVQFQLLSGSTVFAAFLLATDHTTSPVNKIPMLLYGFFGGMILVLIRSFSIFYDGAVFTILLINLCNPLIDRITPKVYGVEVKHNA